MSDLMLCPFCDSTATAEREDTYPYSYEMWKVCCSACKMGRNGYRTRDEAINAWNLRAEP